MITIFLFIILGFILLLSSVLFLPSHLIICYDDDWTIKMKILFITINLYPFPFQFTKKVKSNTSIDKKSSPENKINNIIKNNGPLGMVKSLNKIIKLLSLTSKKILRRIKFKTFYLKLEIQSGDAAETAIKYGQAQILIYNIVARINNITSIKKCKIKITPSFFETDNSMELYLDIYARAIFILYELMFFAKNYAKISNEIK